MENAPGSRPLENGRRDGHRDLPRDVADALRHARRARGWSIRAAARHLGVAASMIHALEHARRRPSVVMAETLIDGYGMTPADARRLRAVALPGVGRDSPWKRGSRTVTRWDVPHARGGAPGYW